MSAGLESLQPLSAQEVAALVESSQPSVQLKTSAEKGRYLVARRDSKAGSVIVREVPLFTGICDLARCKKVFPPEFCDIDEEDLEELDVEDGLHPGSPLLDCIASIILSRQTAASPSKKGADKADSARELLRLRQLDTLHCADVEGIVPEGAGQEIHELLLPEFQALTSKEGLHKALHALSSNRFGSCHGEMEVMFAGSMFEHSCKPNCFYGTWDAENKKSSAYVRTYRTLCDIAQGTALSIDYLLLPDTYAPAQERQEVLSKWGFTCSCERCTALPELSRAFVCPSCLEGELCPIRPGAEELRCLACGHTASEETVRKCFEVEARFRSTQKPPPLDGGGVLSRYHWLVFTAAWMHFNKPGSYNRVPRAANILVCKLLVDCITRLYSDSTHPFLIEVYHSLAELSADDVDRQGHFLALEHATLTKGYPEETEKQDEFIFSMCTHNRPPWAVEEDEKAPWEQSEEDGAPPVTGALSEMD